MLDRGEFARRVAALALLLAGVLTPREDAALTNLSRALDRDWPALTAQEQVVALERAAEELRRIPAGAERALRVRAQGAGVQMERRARRAVVQQGNLNVPGTLPQDEVDAAEQRALDVPDAVQGEFNRRADRFPVVGAVIVSAGISAGLSADDIRDRLVERAESVVRRPTYVRGVAAAVLNRARAASLIATFAEAGVEEFEVAAVLDERTCAKCRFMDGKVFQVSRAREVIEQLAPLSAVADIAAANPFLQEGRNAAGDKIVFFVRDGERQIVARVTRDATGTVDDPGEFADAASEAQLEASGIGLPPYHPDCRCTTLARF